VLAQRVDHLTLRLSAALRNAATSAETRLSRSSQKLLPSLKNAVMDAELRLSRTSQRLTPALKDAVAHAEQLLSRLDQRILPVLTSSLAAAERRLVAASSKLDLLDPNNPLKRGYSLTFDENGVIVRSVSGAKAGDVLTTRLADGEIASRVC
jgi:exodeoxyribonuclease VII large subunit